MDKKTIRIYVDGATVGRNGRLGTVERVGIGVFIPKINFRLYRQLDGISNNEAEFKALIEGMKECIYKGLKNVEFYSDSRIIVNHANGKRLKKKKQLNTRMGNFQNEVLELAKKFDSISFFWIPREQNTVADSLSHKATHFSDFYE